ncbi:MAG: putative baseplate assembly protein [Methanosarcina sp.]
MQVPEICKLDTDTTMQEVRKKAPFYVPEWNTEDERDFGTVLSRIFSGMVDSISSRLNEAPKKHFLSFLDMVNTSLIPASPARAPLTFMLSEGASEDVLLVASTQASADGTDGKAVIFETEKNILATPSKLVSVYSVINVIKEEDKKEKDKIFNHTVAVNGAETTELFAGDSLQKHILYIGDESLFNVQNGQISVEFGLDETELKCLDPEQGLVEWKYSVESIVKENGKEVKKIEWQLLKAKLVKKRLVLDTENKSIDKVKLNGIDSRWLKCQLKDSKIEDLKGLSIISINVLISPPKDSADPQKSQNTSPGITPDCLFINDIPIDPNSNSFHPFGKKPYFYDTFYIGSKDAFSKKETKITLEFVLTPGRPGSINKVDGSINEVDKPQLSWEFWDGESWSLLPIRGDEWEKNLSENIKSSELNDPEPATYKLTISKMPEAKLTRVNGKENYWIRVRMVGGNYGKEYEIVSSREIITAEGNKVSCAEIVPGHFFPPIITNLIINYDTNINNETDQLKQPEYIFTENNLISRHYLNNFKPFDPLPDIPPAIYFGFDKELKKGPFSLFINIDESIEYPETFLPKVKWQYLIKEDPEIWEELEVLDETADFTRKGMVQFNIAGKMQASGLFGLGNQYWIRAVVTGDFFPDTSGDMVNKTLNSLATDNDQLNSQNTAKSSLFTKEPLDDMQDILKPTFKTFNINFSSKPAQKLTPKVRGFYLNSVWAVQSKTIYDEIIGSGTGEINQKFKLVNAPVINETIWINEFTTLSEKERKTLLAEPNRVKLSQDSKGNIMDFWVRWTRVNDFLDSKSKDRHYTIDKTDGDVSFGNGKRGMIPPIGPDNIKATYSIGGGKSGNFDALKISKLQSSIAFVDKVFNPTSSNGGTETEDIDSLLKRAPTVLKNRDRAMALEDYEWLAKKASDEVSRVKALPNFNSERKFSTGWVTVVIVPESSNSKPVPSSELKRRVTSYLKERCPAVVTLRVIPPYYIKVDVSAELITASIDAIPLIEKEARTKISEFLHPLTGSTERNGWRFGGILCISDIYFILEQIKDVDYVNKVIINLYDDSGVTGSTMKLSDASTLAKLPEYALPYSGEHEIIVKWKNNETEG